MQAEQDRAAAAAFLKSLLEVLGEAPDFPNNLFMEQVEAFPCWPLEVSGVGPITLQCAAGQVDLHPMMGIKKYCDMVGKLASGGEVAISLVEFVFLLAGEASSLPQSHIQLALALAPKIEKVVSDALVAGREVSSGSLVSVEFHERLAFGNGAVADERALVEYWHAGRAAAESAQNLSFSVDKSRIFGVGLFCGAALRGDGVAWWMVPQVALVAAPGGLDPRRNPSSAEGLDMSTVDF